MTMIHFGKINFFQKLKKSNSVSRWAWACLIFLVAVCWQSCGSRAEAPVVVHLDGPWYRASGHASDTILDTAAYPFEAISRSELQNLAKLLPATQGYLWLRTSFAVPETLHDKQLGLFLGRITMADQTWLNGSLIGAEGSFPPRVWSAWNVFRNYSVPTNLLYHNRDNTLLIKVYVGGEGSLADKPFLAEKQRTDLSYWSKLLSNVLINGMAATLMVVFGLYHLILFARRPKEKESLSFALLSILGAIYLGNFYAGYIPWFRINPPDFLLFQKIVASMSIYIVAFLFASFVRDFLGRKESKPVFLIRLALMLVPLLIVLVLPNYSLLRQLRGPITAIFLLPMAAYSLYMVIDSLRKHNKDAFALLTGVSPLFVTALLDIILHNIFQLNELPYFAGFGFPLMIMSLLFILASRFAAARSEAENLNINLEGLVEERTSALSATNDTLSNTLHQLEQTQHIAEKDMKMAIQVQRSFYPKQAPKTARWDCAYQFLPMAGVSGDVFDFYLKPNGQDSELDGIGLFDISGHGIAAGLIGMITKSIAANCFAEGRDTSLKQVIEEINQRLMREKGEVENYATGLILRLSNEIIEYVNAGHTELLHRSADTGRVNIVNLPDGRDFKGRFLGIEGLPNQFMTLKFRIRPGDLILAYTDCLIEKRNPAGLEFGIDRLIEVFGQAQGQNSTAILAWIMEELADFCEGTAQNDDLTAILLKKR